MEKKEIEYRTNMPTVNNPIKTNMPVVAGPKNINYNMPIFPPIKNKLKKDTPTL